MTVPKSKSSPHTSIKPIRFVSPYTSDKANSYLQSALSLGHFHGDGEFTKKCHLYLEKTTKCRKALLTHSGTGALEMACLLINLCEGDEVIMPSYTFSSTANAVLLRGAVPVFVDIREDTLNIDENLIEQAVTSKTKAILPVHYAGVSAEMDQINQIAITHGLYVIEDAAQAMGATYKTKPLGTLSDLGAFSFHATKNIIAGEGGALLINNPQFLERAEIIREKGTNRSQFIRGEIDKYTWQDIGSSFLPSDLLAALLLSQLEETNSINEKRMTVWNYYHDAFKELEDQNFIRRPFIPSECGHNAHIYYFIVKDEEVRDNFIREMKESGIQCTSHYVPLHSAPAGKKYGKSVGNMTVTNRCANQIVRLPLWPHLSEDQTQYIIDTSISVFKRLK